MKRGFDDPEIARKAGQKGSPKGTKRQKTRDWEVLRELMLGELTAEIIEYIKTLDPERKLEVYLKLLEYFKPKLGRSEQVHEFSDEMRQTILIAFNDEAEES